MNLIKLVAIGAAVGYGVNYLTKKGPNGRSKIDDIKEKAPEWMDKAKPYVEKAKPYIDQVKNQFNKPSGAGNM
jgi:hypothetical protein